MMQLTDACTLILDQLSDMTRQLKATDFARPSAALSNATLGQHARHTLEFFICLEQGFQGGVVNYDKRSHDTLIETDLDIALSAIDRIREFILSRKSDKTLKLEVGYDRDAENWVTIETNYYRELTYNIEHAVHHMAIMKIGIRDVAPYVSIPPDFGVAVSTLRYQEALAAS
jgi:uncharacterized protein YqgV (UPF0045/DUF77 family)